MASLEEYPDFVVGGWIKNTAENKFPEVDVIPPTAQGVASLWDVRLRMTADCSHYHYLETPDLQDFTVTVITGDEDAAEEPEEGDLPILPEAGRIKVTRMNWIEMGNRSDIFWQLGASETVPEDIASYFAPDGGLLPNLDEAFGIEDENPLLVITEFWLHPEVREQGVLQAALVQLRRFFGGGVVVIFPDADLVDEAPQEEQEPADIAYVRAHNYLRSLGSREQPGTDSVWLPLRVLEDWAEGGD